MLYSVEDRFTWTLFQTDDPNLRSFASGIMGKATVNVNNTYEVGQKILDSTLATLNKF